MAKADKENAVPFDRFNNAESKAACVREIRAYLRNRHGSDPKGKAVYDVFKQTSYSTGDETKDRSYLNTTLSTERRKEREAAGGGRASANGGGGEPTTADLEFVIETAEEVGGMTELAEMVERVNGLVDQLGSREKLDRALTFLNRFGNG